MNGTNRYISILCNADLTRHNALAGIVRESFTVFEAVQLYVEHRRRTIQKEKTAQQAAK